MRRLLNEWRCACSRVAGRRGEGGEGGAPDSGMRLLSTLLTEMDGLEDAGGACVCVCVCGGAYTRMVLRSRACLSAACHAL
jgi:hypothetical protein